MVPSPTQYQEPSLNNLLMAYTISTLIAKQWYDKWTPNFPCSPRFLSCHSCCEWHLSSSLTRSPPSFSSSNQTSFPHSDESRRLGIRSDWLSRRTWDGVFLKFFEVIKVKMVIKVTKAQQVFKVQRVKKENLQWKIPPWEQFPPLLPPQLGHLLAGGDQGDALVVEGGREDRHQGYWAQSWH